MTPASDPKSSTSVYWLYDADDRILYVGRSARPMDRVASYCKKDWGPAIARVVTKVYPNRRSASRAEIAEIRRLNPPHNVMFTTRENNPVHLVRRDHLAFLASRAESVGRAS